MKFVLKKEVPESIFFEKGVIKSINFTHPTVYAMIKRLQPEHKVEILQNLNCINNQGITNIDFSSWSYYINDLQLSFDNLCTSERLFLVATAAKLLKKTVYLESDISQLTKTTLKTFLNLFYECEYVNVIYAHPSEPAFYKSILKKLGYNLDISHLKRAQVTFIKTI